MKLLTTQTILTNSITVEDDLVDGMTTEEIQEILKTDPEYFGVDNSPHVEADIFVSIEDD